MKCSTIACITACLLLVLGGAGLFGIGSDLLKDVENEWNQRNIAGASMVFTGGAFWICAMLIATLWACFPKLCCFERCDL